LLIILSLFVPRIVLFVIWAFTDIAKNVFEGWVWPLLGFLFLPFTTLAFVGAKCWAEDGRIDGWWIALMVVAVLLDLASSKSAT
jgi:hypothetical protein